ncbi:MAG: hypothetical protein CMJ78_27850 [Planctomycetaceae bacterium]|nr:hypothetical protein [Planctomycetaceae bacterium]
MGINITDTMERVAERFATTQNEDGDWPYRLPGEDGAEPSRGAMTFAGLFCLTVARATKLKEELKKSSSKRTENKDEGKTLRADPSFSKGLERAGDIIRVEGNGPYKIPHINIDKDLTIEAGHGYEPVFEYGIGRYKRGLRARPGRDENARVSLRVTKGTLTLEGLKFQMEPPELNHVVPWTALRVEGGNLRMLNVSLTEGGRKRTAMIQVLQPGDVTIQNSLICGGRAAIEVSTTGQQNIEVKNSIFFTKDGIAALNARPAKSPASLNLKLSNSTVQASNGFQFGRCTSTVNIDSNAVCTRRNSWASQSWLLATVKRDASGEVRQIFTAPTSGSVQSAKQSIRSAT